MALTEGTRAIVACAPTSGIPMECGETIKRGDLLFVYTDGTVFQVDSDDGDQARLIAGEDGVDGETIPCYWMAVIDGFTGGTEAAAVYTSTTPGAYTETVDASGAGDTTTIVGYILTETKIIVLPGVRADSVVAT